MAEMEPKEYMRDYFCPPCEVYGRAILRICWNCGEPGVNRPLGYLLNAYVGRSEDYGEG